MESFSNPIFKNIDSNEASPIKPSINLQDQITMEFQLQNQIQQEILKFQGLEKGLESHSYEDLKVEVLQLKNNLLMFQSKFEGQKATNNQNFSTIEMLKKDLAQKSLEVQKLSIENIKAKIQISDRTKLSETVIKSSEPPVKTETFRFSSALETKNVAADAELLRKMKTLEMREKSLGSELLKGYEEKKLLEDKVKSLQKELDNIKQENINEKGTPGDKSRFFDIEKRSLLREIVELKNSYARLEESLANEKENSKKKEAIIEKLSGEKAKVLKDMNKSYEENNQFIAQIEQENQNHLLILQQFQSKTTSYENRITELESVNKTQILEIKSLNSRNENLNEEILKIKPLENDLNALKEVTKKNEVLLKEAQEKVLKLTEELNLKEKALQEKDHVFSKEKIALEQKIQTLDNSYKVQCEHSTVISRNVDIISEEMRTLKKGNLELLSQIKTMEANKTSQEVLIEKLMKEKNANKNLLDEKIAEIEKIQKIKESQQKIESFSVISHEIHEFKDSDLLEESLRLKSQIKEKNTLNELLEKRVESLSGFNKDLNYKIEGLESEIVSLKAERTNLSGNVKETEEKIKYLEKSLKDIHENFKVLQNEKSELFQEKESLWKQVEAKNQLISSYQKHQEDFTRGFLKKEGSDLKRAEMLLLEKTTELENKDSELQKMKDINSSQAFSLKTLNQTLQNYRDAINQMESQMKSLETDKMALETTIRILRQENENFENDKARLRDVLSISNQGKDRLLMELEMKDSLIEQMQRNQGLFAPQQEESVSVVKENEKPSKPKDFVQKSPKKKGKDSEKPTIDTKSKGLETANKNTPKNTPRTGKRNTKKNSKTREVFNLKQGLQEETLYNEVLELSQDAIDLLKKYEQLVNSFHKAKKTIKTNLKDYIRPEIRAFYSEFQEILKRYSDQQVSLRDWLACDGFLKTSGPQEKEINETLMNCKAFLMDFMSREDLEVSFKTSKRRKNQSSEPKALALSGFDDVILSYEGIEEDGSLKGESFLVHIKRILVELEKRKEEKAEFLPKDNANFEKINEILNSLKEGIEVENDQEKLYHKFNEKLNEVLGLIEQGEGSVLLIWLFIKRLQNFLVKGDSQEKSMDNNTMIVVNNIDSDIEFV